MDFNKKKNDFFKLFFLTKNIFMLELNFFIFDIDLFFLF